MKKYLTIIDIIDNDLSYYILNDPSKLINYY